MPVSSVSVADRRSFLKGASGLLLAFGLGAPTAACSRSPQVFAPDAFLRIGSDGRITLICKFLEMGQGIHTGAATLLAEELDVPLAQVRVEHAPVDPGRYASAIMEAQGTGGSASLAESWLELRRAGAAARAMLVEAAAQAWKVPPEALTVEDGVVVHGPSGRRSPFGDLAARAAKLTPPKDPPLKRPEAFRLIGKSSKRVDTPAKCSGAAVYAADLQLDGLKTAMVLHPPRFGARVKTFDPTAARAVPGVVDVVQIPSGVAVVATSTWAAKRGRDALEVTWDETRAERRSDGEIMAAYRALAETTGALVKRDGDAEAGLAAAAKRVVSTSELPFLAHASMEPLACVMRLENGGCEVWYGAQGPVVDRKNVARVLGLPLEKVTYNTILAGGGFGRRTVFDSDVPCEAAEILKARPQHSPLRLQWTREDDIKGGQYRPMFFHRIEAGLDARGDLIAWRHRIVGQPLFPKPGVVDYASIEGSEANPYATPKLIELHSPQVGVPIWAWRAVGNTHGAFAVETAIDEVAHAAGRDPVALRRALLKGQDRHLGVLELAAKKSGWGTPLGPGRGRGFALHKLQGFAERKGPYGALVAVVTEVTVGDKGLTVDRVVCAVDCGLAVNPGIVRDQVEGSVIFGLSAALNGEITLKEGRVEQGNFDTYPVLRMSETPAIEVHLVPSPEPPIGMGEPAVPPVAPSLANAVFAATGRRFHRLPIAPQLSA